MRGRPTAIDEQDFDAEVGVAHAHEENVVDVVVQLQVVVPDVAHQLLHLRLDRALISPGDKSFGILWEVQSVSSLRD